jgi:hypothetical protein
MLHKAVQAVLVVDHMHLTLTWLAVMEHQVKEIMVVVLLVKVQVVVEVLVLLEMLAHKVQAETVHLGL